MVKHRGSFELGGVIAPLFLASCVVLAACHPPAGAAVAAPPETSTPAQGSTTAMRVAVTFDDLPAHGPLLPQQTLVDVHGQILHTLAAHGVPSVYGFINGVATERHAAGRQVL